MEQYIQNTRNQSVNMQYKILLYSLAGIGKSSIIPTLNSPLVFLIENGNALISLANLDIPFIKIHNFQHLLDCIYYFKDDTRFNTFVLDSLSEASLKRVQDLMKDKSKSGNKIHGQQAYGRLLDDFDTLFDNFAKCRQDIVCLAKQMRFISDEGKETFYPMFAGKAIAPIMQHEFDAVISMEKDMQGNRFFRTTSNYQYFAKVRSSVALFEKEEPHLGKLLNKIRGINNV